MHIAKKIENSVSIISKHLENADDKTLKFYDMTIENRDRIVSSEIILKENEKVGLIGMAHNPIHPKLIIHYNPEISDVPQNSLIKVMSHEIGHTNVKRPFNSMELFYTYQLSNILVNSPITTLGMYYLAYKYGDNLAEFLLPAAINFAFQYPQRRIETGCDKLSDKIIPEVTYETMIESFTKNMNLPANTMNLKMSKSPIAQIADYISSHPSDYTRIRNSEKNCPVYLEEKKRLGIQSIYVPE